VKQALLEKQRASVSPAFDRKHLTIFNKIPNTVITDSDSPITLQFRKVPKTLFVNSLILCNVYTKLATFTPGVSNCSESQIRTFKATRGPRYDADATMLVPEPY